MDAAQFEMTLATIFLIAQIAFPLIVVALLIYIVILLKRILHKQRHP